MSTFAYAMLALRHIDGGDGAGSVSGLTVLVAYVLALASVITLVLYMHHAAQALRAAGLIDLVGNELRVQVDRVYPMDRHRREPVHDRRIVAAPRSGVLNGVDVAGLIASARRADCVLELVHAIGDFVPAGAPLFRVHGEPARLPRAKLAGLVVLGSERTHRGDPAFGFRKLVDIAERGVSMPFSDPTTTVQAIDRLHDSLRQMATRPFPTGRHHDREGRLRLIVHTMDWAGYVRLAFDEIRIAGAASPQIPRRLRAALEDLKGDARVREADAAVEGRSSGQE